MNRTSPWLARCGELMTAVALLNTGWSAVSTREVERCVFLIEDKETKAILFMGVVFEPGA